LSILQNWIPINDLLLYNHMNPQQLKSSILVTTNKPQKLSLTIATTLHHTPSRETSKHIQFHHKFHILALLNIPTKTMQPPVQNSTDLPTKIPYVIEQPIFKIHPANLFIYHKFHTLALLKIPTKTT
jgi:hypothetical protein